MLGTALSDDEAAVEDVVKDDSSVAEYSFEGFDVEFSEKVALLPAGAEKK